MSSDSRTKYVILVPDGMADSPSTGGTGLTPLQTARTPWMDKMAAAGTVGLARTIPVDMAPGSDVANLSIMGYSPSKVYTGRAPFEAASMGIELGPQDVAFRLNFVTLERNFTIMADHSAGHISTAEARDLITYLAPIAEDFGMRFVPGVSYRNLLIWENGPVDCITHAPHDFPGLSVARRLPAGDGSSFLLRLILKSWKLLGDHPINQRRVQRCQNPANSVWPWGQGRPPKMQTLRERFGITGSVVAAVDLVKGIGKYAGLDSVNVPGATGYLDTNYQGKVQAALDCLKEQDLVFLHVEAPDEAGHSGQRDLKIKAVEDFDEKVVGPVLAGLQGFDRWRVLLMPDHETPVATRIHGPNPVPYIVLDSREWDPSKPAPDTGFTEEGAAKTGRLVEDASTMIEVLLGLD